MKRTICIFILTITLFSDPVKGQSIKDVEDTVLYYIANINKWDTSYNDDRMFDSLQAYDQYLLGYLQIVLVNTSTTLKYDFPKLKQTRVQILTSDDKKFRIYYWDVGGGAGSHSCDVLVQYKSKTGTKVKVLSDFSKMEEFSVSSGISYGRLYTIKTKTGKTMYMASGAQKIAAGLYMEDLKTFTINNDTLDDGIKFFKTTKELLNEIDYSFEATLVGGNDPSIKVSADKQKISIPIITEEGKTTNKYLTYVFDGNNYVFHKNIK